MKWIVGGALAMMALPIVCVGALWILGWIMRNSGIPAEAWEWIWPFAVLALVGAFMGKFARDAYGRR